MNRFTSSSAPFAAAALILLVAAPSQAVADILIEAQCASPGSYVETGTGWGNSSAKSTQSPCAGGSRSTKNPTDTASFIPTVLVPSTFDVFVTWGTTTGNNDGPNVENTKITLIDRDGTRDFFFNMRGHSSCVMNSDQWILVGRVNIDPGQGHKLLMTHTAVNQCFNGPTKRHMSADAVLFRTVVPVPVVPESWSGIKTRFPG